MRNFIIKRILFTAVLLFIISFLLYAVIRCLPTSFVEAKARELSQRQGAESYEVILAALKAQFGMDTSILAGYFVWLFKAIRGDFGMSWAYNVPVTQKFSEVIWYSFGLGAISLILQVIIAVPLGVVSAVKQYSKTDYAVTISALIGISLPTFFFATILQYVLSIKLGWFDLFGTVGRDFEAMLAAGNYWGCFVDLASHFFMPVVVLTFTSIGGLMRYTRTNMLEVLGSDYIRTARAKGLSEGRVVFKHAFQNTLIPIVTILGGMLPALFGGALITEQLFSITGIGYTSYQAMLLGDINFFMFYMTFIALLTLLGNLLADVLYAVVDPRVRVN